MLSRLTKPCAVMLTRRQGMRLPISSGTQEPLRSHRLGTVLSSSPSPAASCPPHAPSRAVAALSPVVSLEPRA